MLIPLMPFDFAQESIRQAHHERNKEPAVRPEPFDCSQDRRVEGLNLSFLNGVGINRLYLFSLY